MSGSEISAFNRTLHETHVWLSEICDEMNDSRRRMAYHALRGTLFALRDRLTVHEVFDFSAQLPLLIRGIYFEGYRPDGKPETYNRSVFLDRVQRELQPMGGGNPEKTARAVFTVIDRNISLGEVSDLLGALPDSFADLWPSGNQEGGSSKKRDRRKKARQRRADARPPEKMVSDYDQVDEAGLESFPASDPPGW